MAYSFGRIVEMDFDAAVERATACLEDQGFGVLAEIDIAAAMKDKLGVDIPPYLILGACNPPLAHRALSAEPDIGVLLPCNVIVRQDDLGAVHVMAMDPLAVLDLVGGDEITEIAGEVRGRLSEALAAV
ncbi:MAG: DUF302 domain-containing protein [Acidobacteriota bacterium]|jgi:uncharacterized protein (DUF302 family)